MVEATTEKRFQFPWAGLATAFFWSISPIFIRSGLDELPSPLIGVSIGLSVNVVAYGVLLWFRRGEWRVQAIPKQTIYWQLVAAIFFALATLSRWIALDIEPIGIVTAISRISVPIVIVLSLIMLNQEHERVNRNVWIGGAMIVSGAMVLTFTS